VATPENTGTSCPAALLTLTGASSSATPEEDAVMSGILRRVGALIDGRLAGIMDRLLPEPPGRFRPPLGATRENTPSQPLSQKGKETAGGKGVGVPPTKGNSGLVDKRDRGAAKSRKAPAQPRAVPTQQSAENILGLQKKRGEGRLR